MKNNMLKLAIIALVIATAAIHLARGIPYGMLMFILNGLGYLGLVAALYLPQFKRYQTWVRWTLVVFTAVTIIGWIAIGDKTLVIGYVDKVIEIVLIALLLVENRGRAR